MRFARTVGYLCTTLSVVAARQLGNVQQLAAQSPTLQGQCGTFIAQCFKTCVSMASARGAQLLAVAHYCTLQNGVYSVHCGCGPLDETAAVLSLVNVPATIIATVQTTSTSTTIVTTPSTILTTATVVTTQQTSICSSTTILSTIVLTTTINSPTVLVTTTTSTSTATTTIVR